MAGPVCLLPGFTVEIFFGSFAFVVFRAQDASEAAHIRLVLLLKL